MTLIQNYESDVPEKKQLGLPQVRLWLRLLFYFLIIVFGITSFTQHGYRSVSAIVPETLKPPVQKRVAVQTPIQFVRDSYDYNIKPMYDYTLTGLVVHRYDYTKFTFYKMDSVFPVDLCVLWGNNIESKVYQENSLKFDQDSRFCRMSMDRKLDFNFDEVSNNHLIIKSDELEKQALNISQGDQIRIKGKLAWVHAKNVGKPGTFDPLEFEWGTSTTREDGGAGACETIYVESIEILKKANPISYYLNRISKYALLAVIVLRVSIFFYEMKKTRAAV